MDEHRMNDTWFHDVLSDISKRLGRPSKPSNMNREPRLKKGSPEHADRCRALGDFVLAVDAYLTATGWKSSLMTEGGRQRVIWSHPRVLGTFEADMAMAWQRRWDYEDL